MSSTANSTFSRMLADVRDKYNSNPKRGFDLANGNIFIIWFIRPLSIYVTPIFLMMGFTANAATWTGFVFGVTASLFLAAGVPIAVKIGAWLYLVCFLFDHIDGNIARYDGRTNHYGKFLDGATGLIVELALYLALGVGAYRFCGSMPIYERHHIPFDPAYLLFAGGLAAAACVTTSYLNTRYSTAVAEVAASVQPPDDEAPSTDSPPAKLMGVEGRTWKRRLAQVENLVASVEIPLLFVAAYANMLPAYIVAFAAYTTGMCALNYARVVYNGRNTLNVSRSY
jgi:phosphatidylglycerophosphate synthase